MTGLATRPPGAAIAGRRLAASLRTDLRLQLRHGLVLAGVVVAGFAMALLAAFETRTLVPWVPLFAFLQLTMTSYFFVAALVVFEKAEGTLEALVVTPLRTREYLGSKIATLALLGGAEVALVVAWAVGSAVAWLPLVCGLAALSAFYSLAGFVAVARFDSITDFLVPGAAIVTLLQLPALHAAGLWSPVFLWLWPTQPLLLLLTASVEPLSPGEWAYALVYGGASLAAISLWAGRAFTRFVVRREGDR